MAANSSRLISSPPTPRSQDAPRLTSPVTHNPGFPGTWATRLCSWTRRSVPSKGCCGLRMGKTRLFGIASRWRSRRKSACQKHSANRSGACLTCRGRTTGARNQSLCAWHRPWSPHRFLRWTALAAPHLSGIVLARFAAPHLSRIVLASLGVPRQCGPRGNSQEREIAARFAAGALSSQDRRHLRRLGRCHLRRLARRPTTLVRASPKHSHNHNCCPLRPRALAGSTCFRSAAIHPSTCHRRAIRGSSSSSSTGNSNGRSNRRGRHLGIIDSPPSRSRRPGVASHSRAAIQQHRRGAPNHSGSKLRRIQAARVRLSLPWAGIFPALPPLLPQWRPATGRKIGRRFQWAPLPPRRAVVSGPLGQARSQRGAPPSHAATAQQQGAHPSLRPGVSLSRRHRAAHVAIGRMPQSLSDGLRRTQGAQCPLRVPRQRDWVSASRRSPRRWPASWGQIKSPRLQRQSMLPLKKAWRPQSRIQTGKQTRWRP